MVLLVVFFITSADSAVLVLVILALYRTLAHARAVRRRRAQALRHALEHWVYGPHRTRGPAPPPYSRE